MAIKKEQKQVSVLDQTFLNTVMEVRAAGGIQHNTQQEVYWDWNYKVVNDDCRALVDKILNCDDLSAIDEIDRAAFMLSIVKVREATLVV